MEDTLNNQEAKNIDTQVAARRVQFAANVSRILRAATPAFAILFLILWLFFPEYSQLLVACAFILLPAIGAWLYPVFRQRHQARIGAVLLLTSLLIDIAVIYYVLPEIALCLTIVYVFLVIETCLFLGNKDGVWVIGGCLFAFAVNNI
jgi:hypothetical protein